MKSVEEIKYDSNMEIHDFMKLSHQKILHLVFMMIDDLVQNGNKQNKNMMKENNSNNNNNTDDEEMIRVLCEAVMKEEIVEDDENAKEGLRFMISLIAATRDGNLGCFNAFLGGLISQEVIKGITNKYMPINQFVYFDCLEIIKKEYVKIDNDKESKNKKKMIDMRVIDEIRNVKLRNDRIDGLRKCLGDKLVEKIRNTRLFMVGSGAIGCELLKNYAMMSLGTGKPYYTLYNIY